jgi:hypothetical protein
VCWAASGPPNTSVVRGTDTIGQRASRLWTYRACGYELISKRNLSSAVRVGDFIVHDAQLVHTRSLAAMTCLDDHDALACAVHACRVAGTYEA